MESETEAESGLEQQRGATEDRKMHDSKMKMSIHSVADEIRSRRRQPSHHKKRSSLSTFLCCGRNFDSEEEFANESSSNTNIDRQEERLAGVSTAESKASQGPSRAVDQRPSLQPTQSKGSSKEASSVPSFSRSLRVPSRVSEERSKSHANVPIEKREVYERLTSPADTSIVSTREERRREVEDDSEVEITPKPSAKKKKIPIQGTGEQQVSWALQHGRKRSPRWDRNRYIAKRQMEANKKKLSGSMKFLKHLDKMMKKYPSGHESGWLSNTTPSSSEISSTETESSESSESRSTSGSRSSISRSASEKSRSDLTSWSSTSVRPRKFRKKILRKTRGKSLKKLKKKRKAMYKSTSTLSHSRGRRNKKRVKKKPRHRHTRHARRKGKRTNDEEESSRGSRTWGSKASSISRVRSRISHYRAPDKRSDYHLGAVRSNHRYIETCFIPHSGIPDYRSRSQRCRSTVRRRRDRSADDRYRYITAVSGRIKPRASSSTHNKVGGRRGDVRPSWRHNF